MKNIKRAAFVTAFLGMVLFTGCKDLFHPEGPEEWTVTFYAENGSSGSWKKVTVENGDSVGDAMPSNPSRSGYSFDGWWTARDGGGTRFDSTTKVTADRAVYAKWTANTGTQYTVTFNADGGIPATQTRAVNSGASVGSANMPTEPTKSGYTFGGWWTSQNGGGAQFTATTTVTANRTVYAKWTAAVPTTSLQAALTWLDSNAVEGGDYTITVNANESIAPKTLSYSGKNVSLTINGGSVERTISLSSNGSLFTVESGVTLTLGNNITLQGRNDNELVSYSSEIVSVQRGGTLIIKAGAKITGNRSSVYGSGVGVYGGTFIMDGGTISDNYVTHDGGGGAGVYLWPSSNSSELSTFIMNGGTITNNTAEGRGAGVLATDSNFTMNGGEISNNTAEGRGGGVYVEDGTFTMSGGTISGNTAYDGGGGGVYVSSGTFTKQSGGIIYGSNASSTLKNTATNGDSYGHAVYVYGSPVKIRNSTAGTGVTLDSAVSGSTGGWEDDVGAITNITYGSVSGGTWTLQADGSRKSPAISDGSVTKARVSFTSTGSNTSISIQLTVSSESDCDWAFISELDNAYATYESGYYNGSRISGEYSVTVTIPVSSSGSHFIDIGYRKDGSVSRGDDCAWFTVGDASGEEPLSLLDETLTWISANAVEGGDYTITVNANESIAPKTLSYSGKNVTITINGDATERTVSLSSNGSLFTVESGVTLTLGNNVTLQGRSSNTASLVRVNSGGTLVMESGSKITGNSNSSNPGGGVYVNSGIFTMSGGTISGNVAIWGGGVYVGNSGAFTMSGGTISSNTSSSGGGVFVESNGVFIMSNGTISDNFASGGGGGVYVSGSGSFTKQSGGIIYGSNAGNTLKNTASGDGYGHAVCVGRTAEFKIRNTTAGTGVTLNSEISGADGGWEETMPDNLSLSDTLAWVSNNAVEGGDYTITVNANESLSPKTLSYSGKNVSITLTGGSVERTVSLSANGSLFTVESGVTLTLDNNITLQGRSSNTSALVRVSGGGTLSMNTGSVISGNSVSSSPYYGGGVHIDSGTFTMNGGTISDNTISSSSSSSYAYGGGVYVGGSGTFIMNDGTISSNTVNYRGGGVHINDSGTFTMNGGTISDNTALSSPSTIGNGGGVSIMNGGIFTMNDGTISGNTAILGGGVSLYNGGTFTICAGVISGNTASSSLPTYGGGGGVYVNGGTFTKQSGGIIYGSNASGGLKNTATNGDSYGHAVYVYSGSKKRNSTAGIGITLDSAVSGADGGWEETMPDNLSLSDTLAWVSNNAVEGGAYTITVKNDEAIAPRSLSYGGKTVSLTLKGDSAERTVSSNATGSLFTVESGATLILDNNLTLQGRSSNTSALVRVNSGGTLVMESGSKITGNTNTGNNGGGVFVDGGTFTMNNGTVSGNTTSYGGGGVWVYISGTFTMSGGTISGNTANSGGGGGVIVYRGTFTMNGGAISGNTANSGGGVFVNDVGYDDGTFTMSGGEISGNTANSGGGVLVFNSGTFTMSGGTISGNTASSTYGGGVAVSSSSGTFTKQSGGIIYGSNASSTLKNTATSDSYGHAVYVYSGSKKRNSTAGIGVTLDSSKTISQGGGWE